MSHLDIAIVAGFGIALIIMEKLRDIARFNRAMVRGKTTEAQNAWRLHDLYAVEARGRAEGHNLSNSEQYRMTVREIWQAHALIADAFDPNGGTRHIDALEWRWREEMATLAPGCEQV